MESIKPGTLSADGIVCDHALPMHGDGEYRIPRAAPRVEEPEPDMDLESDAAPEAPTVDMGKFFPHWLNRLRR